MTEDAKNRNCCPRIVLSISLAFGLVSGALSAQVQLGTVVDPTQGPVAAGGGDSTVPILSSDGRFVLFASTANNLVLNHDDALPASIPPHLNMFLRDRPNVTTTLVSANLSGFGGANGDSLPAAISSDGRFVLFESAASDLVSGDTNYATDIFLYDVLSNSTTLVSRSTNGGFGNGPSRSATMSPDGRYIAFVSSASNLVADDTNGIPDIFVRDMQSGLTTLVSVGAMATTSSRNANNSSEAPDITPDGRFVVFYSTATNLVPGVLSMNEVYARDLLAATTYWVSSGARTAINASMGTTNVASYNATITPDGQFVAFESSPGSSGSASTAGLILRYDLQTGVTDTVNTNAAVASMLYEDIRSLDMTPDGRYIAFVANTNDTSGATTCILVWDAQSETTTLASGDLNHGVQSNTLCDWPSISSNGQYVAFLSSASNLTTNALAGEFHLYVHDLQADSTVLVDADTNGAGSLINPTTAPCMTPDGRLVAFECLGGNLVALDRNQDYDIFVRNLATATTSLISARDPGLPSLSPNGSSILSAGSLSSDARFLAFASTADNLVPNDTNGFRDVFVRDTLNTTNILVSVSTNGTVADSTSFEPSTSADGHLVAFTSLADNLVAGDTNKAADVFLRDLQAGTTILVSVNSNGFGSGNNLSYSPMISASGRYVLFRSRTTNLAPGTSGSENLFLRDLQSARTFALTTTAVVGAAMTPDGRFVAFNDTAASTAGKFYVWDTQAAARVSTNTVAAGLTSLAISPDGSGLACWAGSSVVQLYSVSRLSGTFSAILRGYSSAPVDLRFSSDGRFLAFAASTNLATFTQVYLADLLTGTNFLLSQAYDTHAAAGASSDSVDISSDGRFVAFRSGATNIVPGDTNGARDIFLFDRQTASTVLLSSSRLGNWPANNRSMSPVFSGDGRTLVFQSWASDIVSGDFNHYCDLLMFDLYASSPIPLYARITPNATPGQLPVLTWPVIPGKSYRVQFKSALGDSQWQELSGGVSVVGNQGYFNDPTTLATQRYYRIVAY